MSARYALYFAPRLGEALQILGNAWLGRDAESGAALPQPSLPGLEPDAAWELTAAPRHYGLHGTWKPPFRLAAKYGEDDLRQAIAEFAMRQTSFQIEQLAVAAIGAFLALVPVGADMRAQAFAAACLRHFDRFRAPPLPQETAARLGVPLSPRQMVLLAEWGYPYVLDEYRFHITLTGPLEDPARRQTLQGALSELFRPVLANPLRIADLCLFAQVSRRDPFRVIGRFPLGRTA